MILFFIYRIPTWFFFKPINYFPELFGKKNTFVLTLHYNKIWMDLELNERKLKQKKFSNLQMGIDFLGFKSQICFHNLKKK